MDNGVADFSDGLAPAAAGSKDRAAEDGDLRWQVRGHGSALEVRDTAKDTEELFLIRRVGLVVVLVHRLVLDHDHDVFEILAKARGNDRERLLDVSLELPLRHPGRAHRLASTEKPPETIKRRSAVTNVRPWSLAVAARKRSTGSRRA